MFFKLEKNVTAPPQFKINSQHSPNIFLFDWRGVQCRRYRTAGKYWFCNLHQGVQIKTLSAFQWAPLQIVWLDDGLIHRKEGTGKLFSPFDVRTLRLSKLYSQVHNVKRGRFNMKITSIERLMSWFAASGRDRTWTCKGWFAWFL